MHLIENWPLPMPLPTLQSGQLHLWRIGLDEPVEALAGLLSPDEQGRKQRFINDRDRCRFIRARGALRLILAQYLETPAEHLVFSHGEKGKPAISHPATELSFNLSHADNLALLAVSRDCAVGVDLEQLRKRDNSLAIARRLFDMEAQRELLNLRGTARAQAFYRHWTLLEARLKALGSGIFDCPSQPSLECRNFIPQEGWMAAVAMEPTLPPPAHWKTWQFKS